MEELVRDDAAHLKNLRLAAGLDHAQLALMANLSAGQVRQLEDGGESLFYSPQIKAQSMRRVIRLLETAPDEAPELSSVETAAPRSSANVIDDIIRLSEKNLKSHVVHSEVRRPGGAWSKLMSVWGLSLVLLVLGYWQYNRHSSQALYSEWVEPITAKVLTKQTTEVTEVMPVPETVPAAPQMPPPVLKAEVVAIETVKPSVALPPAEPAPVKPAPPVVVKETVAAEPAAAVTDDCNNIKTEAVTVSSVSPNKPGSYVYLVSSKAMKVCVDDGKNKRTLVALTPGSGRSVHGSAPWTVATTDMKSLQIFFQGAKVWVPPEAGSRIYLKEQVITP